MITPNSLLMSAALSGLMIASAQANMPGIQIAAEAPLCQCHGVNA